MNRSGTNTLLLMCSAVFLPLNVLPGQTHAPPSLQPSLQTQESERTPPETAEGAKELAQYAAKRFSEVSIDPQVVLSPNAKALNLTVSFIGKDLPELKKCFGETNWLGVMKIITPTCPGLDSKTAVDSAVAGLKKREFQMLVTIAPASVPKQRDQKGSTTAGKTATTLLFCYRLPCLDDPDAAWDACIAGGSQCWQVNPDGTGLLQNWKPTERQIFLLVNRDIPYVAGIKNGNYVVEQQAIRDQLRSAYHRIRCKQDSGELSDQGAEMERRAVRMKTRSSLLALLQKF